MNVKNIGYINHIEAHTYYTIITFDETTFEYTFIMMSLKKSYK